MKMKVGEFKEQDFYIKKNTIEIKMWVGTIHMPTFQQRCIALIFFCGANQWVFQCAI
jgi:hypothetical protein